MPPQLVTYTLSIYQGFLNHWIKKRLSPFTMFRVRILSTLFPNPFSSHHRKGSLSQ